MAGTQRQIAARLGLPAPLILWNGTSLHLKDAIPTRSSLLERVRDADDNEAWEDFRRTYDGLIRRLAMKAGLSEVDAEDVAQDVLIGVHRNIGEFKYDRSRCTFKSWLSRLIRWRISDRLQHRLPTASCPPLPKDDTDPTWGSEAESMPVAHELEAVWETEWQTARLELACKRLKHQVTDKSFQIFFLHALKGHPASEVARLLNVNRAEVYLVKLRVGRKFRKILAGLDLSAL